MQTRAKQSPPLTGEIGRPLIIGREVSDDRVTGSFMLPSLPTLALYIMALCHCHLWRYQPYSQVGQWRVLRACP